MKIKVKSPRQKFTPQPNYNNLHKVISGAQIGADIAALRAAKKLGLQTGGHMPEGFLTLLGRKPGYSWMYDCIDDALDYKSRTWKNVYEADATIRLANNFFTPGERCTLNAIRKYKKPSLDIYMEPIWYIDGDAQYQINPEETAEWIIDNNIKTLNVAGNADVALEEPIFNYLLQVFNIIVWE